MRIRDRLDLPDPKLQPPTIAESGDPFAALRVAHLLARIERGTPVPVADIVARLNADYLDWTFSLAVVVDTALQLRANWMADYRNTDGIQIDPGPYGPAITIEDTSRVDPWIVKQVERLAGKCRERLREFARGEGRATEG